jgi:Photosynthesis system II assembly factor YCF48
VKDDAAREKAIDQLVAEKLRGSAGTPPTACPDAGIIAAYFERTLAPKERAKWEVHFDGCARCQAGIAALVRMDEADEASLRAPQAPVAAPAAAPASAPARKTFGLRWAWVAPLFLAAVVAGLWYTGELQPLLHQTGDTGARVTSPPPAKPPQPLAAGKSPASPAPPSAAQKAKAPETPPVKNELQPAAPPPEQRMSNAPLDHAQAQPPRQAAETVEGPTARADATTAAPAPPAMEPKAAPQPVAAQGAIASPAERARLQIAPANEREVTAAGQGLAAGVPARVESKPQPGTKEESPTVESASPAASQGQAGNALGGIGLKKGLFRAESSSKAKGSEDLVGGSTVHYAIVSAKSDKDLGKTSSPELWRVGPHGLIQKQNADGMWGAKSSGVSVDLFDITFPDPDVGWAVGQSGMILWSDSGGERWSRVSTPTNEDLVRVTATSTESAKVTTRSGMVFSTSDGGKSWTHTNAAP